MKKSSRVIIRDLPGAADLEAKLLLYGANSLEAEKVLVEFSRAVFGITEEDTRYPVPDHYLSLPKNSEERRRINEMYMAHEDRFETMDLTDDEIVELLLEMGLDFSNERGQPLLCTIPLSRQAEAAAKGLMGRMPDQCVAEADRWGGSLEAEATAWKRSKSK